MSYLDDPRVLFAAERTLLAWQRTAIALMGFGFVVERFGLFLRMVSNQALSASQRGFSLWLGVTLLVLGAAVSATSALQYRTVLRSLSEKEIPPATGPAWGCGSTSFWPSSRSRWPPISSPATSARVCLDALGGDRVDRGQDRSQSGATRHSVDAQVSRRVNSFRPQ